jgi:hypothetical protein
MSYKTFLGATAVVQSYDGSGVSYGSGTAANVSPVDEDPKESPAKPKDEVAEGPTGGEDYSEQNSEGGNYKPKDDDKSSFNPTIIIGILAIAYFLFKKKK